MQRLVLGGGNVVVARLGGGGAGNAEEIDDKEQDSNQECTIGNRPLSLQKICALEKEFNKIPPGYIGIF